MAERTSRRRRVDRPWSAPARRVLGDGRLLASAALCRFAGRPDVRRWSDPRTFRPEWDERLRVMAELVAPGSRVLDVGAGPEGIGRWLDPSCACVALDVVPRGPASIVCDLNKRPLPDLRPLDLSLATLGGVLEYVTDVRAVVAWLGDHVATCIVSYEPAPGRPGHRPFDVLRRMRAGWVSSLTEDDLVRAFSDEGFVRTATAVWDSEDGPGRIFVFARE